MNALQNTALYYTVLTTVFFYINVEGRVDHGKKCSSNLSNFAPIFFEI